MLVSPLLYRLAVPFIFGLLIWSGPVALSAQDAHPVASESAEMLESLSDVNEKLETARSQLVSITQSVQERRKHLDTLRQQAVKLKLHRKKRRSRRRLRSWIS
jgi:chromosome segregation ATPase